MPIASVVITLDARATLHDAALAALRDDERVEVGNRVGARVPAVLETRTADEGEALVREIASVPGVLLVELVGVYRSLDEGDA